MPRRFIASILLLFVLSFSFHKPAKVDAFPAAIPLAALASIMVAAGAVGTVTLTNNVYGGTLWSNAQAVYDGMTTDLKTSFDNAVLAANTGYFLLSQAPGLWDYLHGKFKTGTTIVPITNFGDPTKFLEPLAWINVHMMNINTTAGTFTGSLTLNKGSFKSANAQLLWGASISGVFTGSSATNDIKIKITNYEYSTDNPFTLTNQQKLDIYNWAAFMTSGYLACNWLGLAGATYNQDTILMEQNVATGTWPGTRTTPLPTTTIVNDGDTTRTVTLVDPLQLNNATVTTPLTNLVGVTSTVLPTAAQIAEADLIANPPQPVDMATTIATSITTGLTNTFGSDTSINWDPLKISGNLLTTKFPFSIPWDIKNSIDAVGTGSTLAPKWEIELPAPLSGKLVIDLSFFEPIVPAVRALELFAFTVSLALATRKMLGGDV